MAKNGGRQQNIYTATWLARDYKKRRAERGKYALILKAQGKTQAELLKDVKRHTVDEKVNIRIRSARQTNYGDLFMIVVSGKAKTLHEILKHKMMSSANVQVRKLERDKVSILKTGTE